jgi:hypothetical protein
VPNRERSSGGHRKKKKNTKQAASPGKPGPGSIFLISPSIIILINKQGFETLLDITPQRLTQTRTQFFVTRRERDWIGDDHDEEDDEDDDDNADAWL